MYDTSFDDARAPRTDRTVLWALRVAGLIATIAAVSADAQMPGALADSTASTAQIPVGVGIGWRRAFGGSRGVSFYATPSYIFCAGGSHSGSLFRTSVAADFGITQRIGATAGIKIGATRSRAIGGPSGRLYGVGVSCALGRR